MQKITKCIKAFCGVFLLQLKTKIKEILSGITVKKCMCFRLSQDKVTRYREGEGKDEEWRTCLYAMLTWAAAAAVCVHQTINWRQNFSTHLSRIQTCPRVHQIRLQQFTFVNTTSQWQQLPLICVAVLRTRMRPTVTLQPRDWLGKTSPKWL